MDDDALRNQYPSMFPQTSAPNEKAAPTSTAAKQAEEQLLRGLYPSMFPVDPAGATPPAPPSDRPSTPTSTAAKTEAELLREMYPTMHDATVATPTTPAAPAPVPTPADPATVAAAADARALGFKVEGLSDSQTVAARDALDKINVATKNAEFASWEAQARALPASEIAAAQSFAATLDSDVREVLASSGLGSHPAVIRLAAKLARR